MHRLGLHHWGEERALPCKCTWDCNSPRGLRQYCWEKAERSCLICGLQQTFQADTMGHPNGEHYWTTRPRSSLPVARTIDR